MARGTRYLYRRPRRRWRLFVWTATGALVLAGAWFAGLVWFTGQIPGRVHDRTSKSDAIVVLTGGSERVATGIDLLARHRGKKLFVSGVYHGTEVSRLLELSKRAPDELECCVALGYTAGDTVGNARETARWMERQGYGSMRLVTANYHMPRSLLVFRRAMPEVTIIPHPVFPDRVKVAHWWQWPGTASLLAEEYTKYLITLVRAHGLMPRDRPHPERRARNAEALAAEGGTP